MRQSRHRSTDAPQSRILGSRPHSEAGTRIVRARPEQSLHQQVAQFLSVALGTQAMFFHIPNGGRRSRVEAAIFKSLGVKAGMPDICILDTGEAYFIELKARKGRLSDAQRLRHAELAETQCPVGVAESLDEVIALLRGWGVSLRAKTYLVRGSAA